MTKAIRNQEHQEVEGIKLAIRQLRYNNDPMLRKKCRQVTDIDLRTRQILDDMLDTLHAIPNGAALAACQVGILRRLVVIDMGTGIMKLINPVIIQQEGIQECVEGCLSFPNRFGKTIRPKSVTVKALDEDGNDITITGEDAMAKCLCHELDHLDGIVFIDKVLEFIDPNKPDTE